MQGLHSEGRVSPSVFNGPASLHLSPGDVIVMSGGAAGITAPPGPQSLAPFRPPFGSSGEDLGFPSINPVQPRSKPAPAETFTADHRAMEIAQTMADLHAAGIEATYIPVMSPTPRRSD